MNKNEVKRATLVNSAVCRLQKWQISTLVKSIVQRGRGNSIPLYPIDSVWHRCTCLQHYYRAIDIFSILLLQCQNLLLEIIVYLSASEYLPTIQCSQGLGDSIWNLQWRLKIKITHMAEEGMLTLLESSSYLLEIPNDTFMLISIMPISCQNECCKPIT